MTDLDLDAIEARADAATDGPWVVKHEPAWEADNVQHPDVITVGAQMWEGDDEPMTVCLVSTDYEDDPVDVLLDAEFIAHARTDVPALVAALREARAEVEHLHAEAMPRFESWMADDNDRLRRERNEYLAERDDWRRRYEALRDGVTGLCDEAERRADPGVRLWSMPEARIKTSDLRAVVARVEGDES